MFDPYASDTPGMGEPARDLVPLTPDDDNDLAVGVKALRIYNPLETAATIYVITAAGVARDFKVPAACVWTEPLRINRLLEATTDGIEVHGYTDVVV